MGVFFLFSGGSRASFSFITPCIFLKRDMFIIIYIVFVIFFRGFLFFSFLLLSE